jgi:parallel beta-helix repeat protein
MALVALLSVGCEEPAVTPPGATSSPVSSWSVPTQLPCEGVAVVPGADIQPLIDANPPGSTFCFAKGLYRLTGTVQTKEKTPTFDLRDGAVIDGGDGGFIGISGPDGQGLGAKILGGVFQHFGNDAAPSWVCPLVVRDDGVVDGTEFKENFNAGLAIQGDRARVSNVYAHDNGRYGVVATKPCSDCADPVGIVLEDSEVAFNNTRQLDTGGDAGGTKFTRTDGMIVRGNHVHDNYGAGLWFDVFNRNADVYDNDIHDNLNWGILYEISFGGTKIHGNTLRNNGGDGRYDWFNAVQLLVAGSDGAVGGGGIEIYGNSIDGTAYAVGLIVNGTRPRTRAVYVHDNIVTLRAPEARVGAVAFDGLDDLFQPAADNRFEDNSYRVIDPGAAYWFWNGEILTWSQWRSLGHDVSGTVEPIA